MKRVSPITLLFISGFIAGMIGCGRSVNPNERPTYKTKVTVLQNGMPVEGANVVFNPLDSSTGVAAYGRTNVDGVTAMTTYSTGDGAVEDSFRVTVTKLEQRKPDVPMELYETDPERFDELMIAAGSKAKPPAHLLPEKFAFVKSTDLTAEVRPSGDNNFQFELSSQTSK